jgi:hypothetical protein
MARALTQFTSTNPTAHELQLQQTALQSVGTMISSLKLLLPEFRSLLVIPFMYFHVI